MLHIEIGSTIVSLPAVRLILSSDPRRWQVKFIVYLMAVGDKIRAERIRTESTIYITAGSNRQRILRLELRRYITLEMLGNP